MSYAKRMIQLPTSRVQYVFALTIVVSLGFSLGVATIFLMTSAVDQAPQTTLGAPVTENPAAAVGQAKPVVEQVPYDGNWALYDNGWAGGPPPQAGITNGPALNRVYYEAGWDLYDDGWAGGPGVD